MKLNTIEPLKWDSQFFGYPVAKIVFDHKGYDKLDILFRQLRSKNVRLTYLFVPSSDLLLGEQITKLGGYLVDQKTIYSKPPEKHEIISNKIVEFQGSVVNERLIELALQAGLYSRYNLDINFNNKEYERLYTEWLKKSLNKTLAIKTFIALSGSEIIGITTLGEKSGIADIGLVAVDINSRGMGIATDLIHFADDAAYKLGYSFISVVTQLRNLSACKLYEKCNFQIESIVNVYHIWQ